jgi:hypothetical protein
MSAYWGRPEVIDARSERRDWSTESPQRSGKQRIKPTIRVDGIIVHKALAVTIAEFEKVRRFVCCLGML